MYYVLDGKEIHFSTEEQVTELIRNFLLVNAAAPLCFSWLEIRKSYRNICKQSLEKIIAMRHKVLLIMNISFHFATFPGKLSYLS